MELLKRIRSFEYLGDLMARFSFVNSSPEFTSLTDAGTRSVISNPWFTTDNITLAMNSLGQSMISGRLEKWLEPYFNRIEHQWSQNTIGVIMAGNLPLVGFHDFMCVLISGNRILVRLSSEDALLLPALARILVNFNPLWADMIVFTTGKIENFDAVVATGNNNSSRYFDYYFGKYPHIIRHNRNSVAILHGHEEMADLEKLSDDIMLYFGLGCRSVSKIFLPESYDFSPLIDALHKYSYVINHHKYFNNYSYNKSILFLNQVPFIDTGFLLLTESSDYLSRIGVLHYSYYNKYEDVDEEISRSSGNIQCVVSETQEIKGAIRLGKAQYPGLGEYADNIDTMNFLIELGV